MVKRIRKQKRGKVMYAGWAFEQTSKKRVEKFGKIKKDVKNVKSNTQ